MSKKKDKMKEASDLITRFIEGLVSSKMKIEEGEWIVEQLQVLADDAVPCIVKILASPTKKNASRRSCCCANWATLVR